MCYFCARRLRPSSSALPLPFQRDRSAITASPWACRKLKTKLLFLVFLSLFLRHLDWGGVGWDNRTAFVTDSWALYQWTQKLQAIDTFWNGTVKQDYKWRKVHLNKCVSACIFMLCNCSAYISSPQHPLPLNITPPSVIVILASPWLSRNCTVPWRFSAT